MKLSPKLSREISPQRLTQKGQAILELAMVLPVLIIIGFTGIEFSQALRTKQLSRTLSREAASMAYRDCSLSSGVRTVDCLNQVRASVMQSASLRPGTNVVLTMYESSPNINRFGPTGGSSRFSMGDLNTSGNSVGDLIRSQKVAVVAEVEVRHNSALIFLPFSFGTRLFYDATIL